MELPDRELKDRKEKIEREIEELLHQPLTVSKDDMDKFEKQEMKKIRRIIRKWFDRLINTNVMGKKPEIIRDKLKDKIIRDISRLFGTKKEERKKKKYNGRINEDRKKKKKERN